MYYFNNANWVCTDMLEQELYDSITTGFSDLDILTRGGFMRGGLTVIGSIHPMENSVFIKSILHSMIKTNYYSAMVFSLRLPEKIFMKELLKTVCRMPAFPDEIKENNEEDLRKTAELISELPLKFYDLKTISSINEIEVLCKENFKDSNLDYIFIDGVDLINNDQCSRKIMKRLKKLAVIMNCVVVLTTSSLKSEITDKKNYVPRISDFENNEVTAYADQVFVLLCENYQNEQGKINDDIVQIHAVRGKAKGYTNFAYLKAFGLYASIKSENG